MKCPYCKTPLIETDNADRHVLVCHLEALMLGRAKPEIEAAYRRREGGIGK